MKTNDLVVVGSFLYKVTAYGTLEWLPPVINKMEYSQ